MEIQENRNQKAVGECLYNCFELSQTFKGFKITLWKLEKKLFYFFYNFYKMNTQEILRTGKGVETQAELKELCHAIFYIFKNRKKFITISSH